MKLSILLLFVLFSNLVKADVIQCFNEENRMIHTDNIEECAKKPEKYKKTNSGDSRDCKYVRSYYFEIDSRKYDPVSLSLAGHYVVHKEQIIFHIDKFEVHNKDHPRGKELIHVGQLEAWMRRKINNKFARPEKYQSNIISIDKYFYQGEKSSLPNKVLFFKTGGIASPYLNDYGISFSLTHNATSGGSTSARLNQEIIPDNKCEH